MVWVDSCTQLVTQTGHDCLRWPVLLVLRSWQEWTSLTFAVPFNSEPPNFSEISGFQKKLPCLFKI